MRSTALLLFLALGAVTACGGSSSDSTDASVSDAGQDAPNEPDRDATGDALACNDCDANAPDAHDAHDAGDAQSDGACNDCDANAPDASFACGTHTCDEATQYCENDNGGAVLPDGGVNATWTCKPFPATCDGGPSCACVGSHACACADDGGAVTVTCDFP